MNESNVNVVYIEDSYSESVLMANSSSENVHFVICSDIFKSNGHVYVAFNGNEINCIFNEGDKVVYSKDCTYDFLKLMPSSWNDIPESWVGEDLKQNEIIFRQVK